MDSSASYRHLFDELISECVRVFGPDIVYKKVSHVKGIQLSPAGKVVGINGAAEKVLTELAGQLAELSPLVAQKKLEEILNKRIQGAQISTTEMMHQAHLQSASPRSINDNGEAEMLRRVLGNLGGKV